MAVATALRSTAGRLSALAGPVATAGASVAAFTIVALVDPTEPGRYPTCPFLAVTGHWCPGCGSLRAMHSLSNGEIDTALGLNVLTVSVLPLVAFLWWRWIRRQWGSAPRAALAHPVYLYGLLVVVVVFWVARNLPWGSPLAP